MGAVDSGRSVNRFVCINNFNILNDVRPLHVLKGKMCTHFQFRENAVGGGQGRGVPERANATKLKGAQVDRRHEQNT